ncbi:unnamed protein product [Echinostoma caproni]|uniref:Anoctamin n=1 Tax=Echinostoma caproni TaxID=27848 RepID=A0A183AGY1_9TREM|nr:unnamed protein product [Echinostoma caproni]
MCEATDLRDGCGYYTDIPPDWGQEELASDEIALLVVGILLDAVVFLFCTFIVIFKFGEEIRGWIRTRLKGRLYPYENISDYLRGTEAVGPVTPAIEKEEARRTSVGEMEAAGEFVDEVSDDAMKAELAQGGRKQWVLN